MTRTAAKDKTGSAVPAISVLVVAYQSGPTLDLCLKALAAQTWTDFEVVVVDNGSTDGAPQAAARAFPDWQHVAAGENLGFAGGVNLAANLARGRWIALINPDAYAESDWLEELLAGTEAFPAVRCFGSRQLMDENPDLLDGLGDVMSISGIPYRGGYRNPDPGLTSPGEAFSACGGAMLMERDLFLKLGGLDERLFCYCEDVDLGYRLRLIGEPTIILPKAVVRHEGSAASGGPRSDFAVFHGTRNRLWVFVKNTPPLLFWLSLPLHIAATAVLFARDISRGEAGAPWRGIWAAFAGMDTALAMRREAQATRRVSSWAVARAMSWSPLDLFQRRVVIRPVRPSPPVAP